MIDEVKKEQKISEEEKEKSYLELREVLKAEDLLTYSGYVDEQKIVVTIFMFDLPLKQIKIDLTKTDLEIINTGEENAKN